METIKKTSKTVLWISYILQGIVVLMFLMGAVQNLMQSETAVTQAMEMGYPESSVLYLGLILLISTVLYAIPKTNVIGAVLLTAWLGGAVATHVIHKDPFFYMILPVIFGIVIWLSIWLRDKQLKTLIPIKK
ncbi:DoxX family protein [Tenacibaculum singaporense]|uniref:DoxX family protein n=1 Tax=Tenacibaculum singaporense TaxID=2358479 RepID=UPI000F666DE0|nr:DoxX family protein [Tenacibaculum singaporense]RSC93492.1 DoxX family protein [Tenacibaculum singaporense]